MHKNVEYPMSNGKNKPNQLKPYLFIIGAAVLWASGGTASKYLFNAGMHPYTLAQYRVSFSALLILGYLLFFQIQSLRINIRDLGYFIALGVLGMAGVQVTYLFAISKIKVAIAILLSIWRHFSWQSIAHFFLTREWIVGRPFPFCWPLPVVSSW